MSVKYFFIPLILIVIPTTAAAHSDWLNLAYLSILIPISFLPFIVGLQRIRHDIKKHNIKLKGSVLAYWIISLSACSIAIVLFSMIGIVHYFMLTTIGPLLGFLIFQTRLKAQIKKNGTET
jgi:energy-converting hydrogenase Eha subunit B